MLTIVIPAEEVFNEADMTFTYTKEYVLKLEHSLLSISKWESKWKKPFLAKNEKTPEEIEDYIRCMTINNVEEEAYTALRKKDIDEISKYIDDPMTASNVPTEKQKSGRSRTITSELIYCWMIQLQIPVSFEKWHLNRLLMLIKVCNAENKPPKKMTAQEQRDLNEARIRASKAKRKK